MPFPTGIERPKSNLFSRSSPRRANPELQTSLAHMFSPRTHRPAPQVHTLGQTAFGRAVATLLPVLALAAGCAKPEPAPEPPASPNAATQSALSLSPQQIAALGIGFAPAQAASALPLGSVPATITLPPAARVAVTTPYPGTLVRLLVIEGQSVRAGEALGVVKAAQSVQFSGALARSRAELPMLAAQAARLSQLAAEGIIAPARADEARASLRAAQATLAENQRLLAMGGAGSADGTITLRAPIAGRVAAVSAQTGAMVGDGAAPFLVENTSQFQLDLQIPERLAHKARKGAIVDVLLDGVAGRGVILSVAPSIDPQTRALAAKASLNWPAGLPASAVPGKNLQATLRNAGERAGDSAASDAGAPALTVPLAAITRLGDQDVVFVRLPADPVARSAIRLRATPVVVAGEAGGMAFIQQGLRAGTPVAISGIAELKSLSAGQ